MSREPSSTARPVTIATVAKAAGVSVATVSRVMNGVPTVDAELVERVRQAAAETGYRPNAIAQGLARGSLRTLGVVVPNLANPYFYQTLKAIEVEARLNDFRTLVADANESIDEEISICKWLASHVDCLILCSPRMPSSRLMKVKELVPASVMTNRHDEAVPMSSVCISSQGAMTALAEHLIGLGHRRVVCLTGPERSWAARDRLRSLMSVGTLDVSAVACGGTIDDGYRVLPRALDLEPTAIVCFNDLVAFGALARLVELGIRVPEHVSLAGFDDIPFSNYANPSLTSVISPHEEMGRRAWRQVQELINSKVEPTVTFLEAELVVRGSTGPARSLADDGWRGSAAGSNAGPAGKA
jgi:DNA-binding LacI/PurR family transcriptional regulator